jgi:hypothetical protein
MLREGMTNRICRSTLASDMMFRHPSRRTLDPKPVGDEAEEGAGRKLFGRTHITEILPLIRGFFVRTYFRAS